MSTANVLKIELVFVIHVRTLFHGNPWTYKNLKKKLLQLSKIGYRKALLTFVLPRFRQDALHSSSYWTWYVCVCVRKQTAVVDGWLAWPSSQLFNHWGSVNRLTWKFGPIHRPAASRNGNCSLMVQVTFNHIDFFSLRPKFENRF